MAQLILHNKGNRNVSHTRGQGLPRRPAAYTLLGMAEENLEVDEQLMGFDCGIVQSIAKEQEALSIWEPASRDQWAKLDKMP